MAPEDMANTDSYKAEDSAMLDVIMGSGTSRMKKVSCLRKGLGQ